MLDDSGVLDLEICVTRVIVVFLQSCLLKRCEIDVSGIC